MPDEFFKVLDTARRVLREARREDPESLTPSLTPLQRARLGEELVKLLAALTVTKTRIEERIRETADATTVSDHFPKESRQEQHARR